MRKFCANVFFGLLLVGGSVVMGMVLEKVAAQNAPQATAKPSATPAPVVEEKKKPVILEKPVLLELSNLELRQENARLKAEAAIPQSVKDEMKKIGEELDKFWLDRGIKREELATRWIGSKGQGGAIILTPIADEKPAPKTPEK